MRFLEVRNITLKQLRAFVMVARERSFTRAAGQLNLSQSALTLQVRELENEVGLKLLHRSTRSVELTSAGLGFLSAAERLLDDLTRALDDLSALARGVKGSVVVVAGASLISLVVAPSIARLAKSFPGISVRILEDVGDQMVRRVTVGEADFGIATFARPTKDLETSLLLKDRIGVLCTRDHPLATTRALSWRHLTDHPFAILEQSTALRAVLEQHPDIAATLPRAHYEASSMSALVSLVEERAAMALLPGLAALPTLGRKLVFRPVRDPGVYRDLFFVSPRRRNLTSAARQVALEIISRLDSVAQTRKVELSMSPADLAAIRTRLEVMLPAAPPR
jgi:DNA-binding transcriptional LysR family regulator